MLGTHTQCFASTVGCRRLMNDRFLAPIMCVMVTTFASTIEVRHVAVGRQLIMHLSFVNHSELLRLSKPFLTHALFFFARSVCSNTRFACIFLFNKNRPACDDLQVNSVTHKWRSSSGAQGEQRTAMKENLSDRRLRTSKLRGSLTRAIRRRREVK